MLKKINVAVIGCGLIGQRRANVVAQDKFSQLLYVTDVNAKTAESVAKEQGCSWSTDWKKVVRLKNLDVVIVSTPNHWLSPIASAALRYGKHVLIEKPMGKNLKDARKMHAFANRYHRRLKVGFNHRYHPAIHKAYQLYKEDAIGEIINVRCQYGHGGRAGYEKEWRGNAAMAGGGELTDQGVHLIDLIQWFCGKPSTVYAALQTAFWPVSPSEDNGFALLQYKNGVIANFHSSWTQWKNLFRFEVFGKKGTLCINGLGGSYGVETLDVIKRKPEGGIPEIISEKFEGPDLSWQKEWNDFREGIVKASFHKQFRLLLI